MQWLLRSTILVVLAAATGAMAADQPRRVPRGFDPDATDRIIVKFRDPGATRSALVAESGDRRVAALAQRSGRQLRLARSISDTMHAVHLGRKQDGKTVRAMAAELARDPAVEFAVPDRRRFTQAVPNDPLYGTNEGNMNVPGLGVIAQQWYLTPPTAALPSAINAEQAWDLSNGIGSAAAPVAVIDTGVLFDHPDLGRVANGGKLLPGHDFIDGDDFPNRNTNFSTANDNSGRDADPSDPGDWISAADLNNSVFAGCEVSNSSWHGTHIAALIGARSNNGTGGTGVGWNTPVLPVRVLGKCAGYDSDILAAMRWAAGLTGTGAPTNANPVRVINLSLGSPSNSCSSSYQTVITELVNLPPRGVLVVIAGGNETGPVAEPGRCSGAFAVAALRHVGSKVGFSSFGAEIAISAPGGNCVNANGACLRPIVSASNTGTQGPDANGMAYEGNVGTSFSAPMVAGVAGLMLARNSNLTVDQLRTRLQRTARPFATESGLLSCNDPTFVADGGGNFPNSGSCNCTTSTCGAGMLDARRAALSATNAIAVVSGSTTATATQATTLSGTFSLSGPSASANLTYDWTSVSGPAAPTLSGTNTSDLTFTAPTAGTYVVRLTVTDSNATSESVDHTITASAAPPPPASGGGGGAIGLFALLFAALGVVARIRRK